MMEQSQALDEDTTTTTSVEIVQLETFEKVKEFIKIEECYIWTDSDIFKEAFKQILDKRTLTITPDDIRDLLSAY